MPLLPDEKVRLVRDFVHTYRSRLLTLAPPSAPTGDAEQRCVFARLPEAGRIVPDMRIEYPTRGELMRRCDERAVGTRILVDEMGVCGHGEYMMALGFADGDAVGIRVRIGGAGQRVARDGAADGDDEELVC